jgi:hypothetical protein
MPEKTALTLGVRGVGSSNLPVPTNIRINELDGLPSRRKFQGEYSNLHKSIRTLFGVIERRWSRFLDPVLSASLLILTVHAFRLLGFSFACRTRIISAALMSRPIRLVRTGSKTNSITSNFQPEWHYNRRMKQEGTGRALAIAICFSTGRSAPRERQGHEGERKGSTTARSPGDSSDG